MQLEDALNRAVRRSALWANARTACLYEEQFRASTHIIEKAVRSRLDAEFPTPTNKADNGKI
jgi:hypothetical protein